MHPTGIPKHGQALRVVGYIVGVPSTAVFLLLTASLFIGSSTHDISAVIAGGCVVAVFYGVSLLGLVIGYTLLGWRKVWKCGSCGYYFDRA
jgi:hypothetical protein